VVGNPRNNAAVKGKTRDGKLKLKKVSTRGGKALKKTVLQVHSPGKGYWREGSASHLRGERQRAQGQDRKIALKEQFTKIE